MRVRLVHIGLAFLILIQSVSTLAFVPATAVNGDGPAQPFLSEPSQRAPQESKSQPMSGPCHHAEAAAEATADHGCCDDMKDAGCILSCFSVASAVSLPSILESIDIHVRYPQLFGYVAPHRVSSSLYRPPRIS